MRRRPWHMGELKKEVDHAEESWAGCRRIDVGWRPGRMYEESVRDSAGRPPLCLGSHLAYSTRGGEKPQLSRAEFEKAQQEGWWGTAISYNIAELE